MKNSKGELEHRKFARQREKFTSTMEEIIGLDYSPTDFIHHFPAFVGTLTLARFLSLFDAYKQTLGVAGHIAELGVYKGAGSIFFAKLIQMFEPHSLTLVHGFDWFKGAEVTEEERHVSNGECQEDYERIAKLIELQELDNIVHLHNLDIRNDLEVFFRNNSHLQFKLIFFDCGIYDVVKAGLTHFWPRLTPGGIVVFDHFNHEFAPGETRAVKELLPDKEIKAFPFGWMPTAYVVK